MNLVDIVSEIQPDFDKGSSLASIKNYLEANGLFTLAVKPAAGSALVSPYLALVHLRPTRSTIGHYVVLLTDSDSNTAIVWSGQLGRLSIPMWQFDEMIDGGLLLVSSNPITEFPSFSKTTDLYVLMFAITTISTSLIVIVALVVRLARRGMSSVTPTLSHRLQSKAVDNQQR